MAFLSLKNLIVKCDSVYKYSEMTISIYMCVLDISFDK